MPNPLMLASPHKPHNSHQSIKLDGRIFKVPGINVILGYIYIFFFFLSYGKTGQGSILLENCNVSNFVNSSLAPRHNPMHLIPPPPLPSSQGEKKKELHPSSTDVNGVFACKDSLVDGSKTVVL